MAGEREGIVLLSTRPSLFAIKVKIALSEKGVEYENQEEVLSNKSNVLLKMNPVHKQIPVLIQNGRPVCESLVIVEYIDQVWNRNFSGTHSVWFGTGEAQEGGKKELTESKKLLEQELGEKAYFGGESAPGPVARRLLLVVPDTGEAPQTWLREELELPKLEEWLMRCLLRESVATALPDQDKLDDLILQIRKKKLEVQAPAN